MNDFSNLYNIDILCINCQDMINVTAIDEHSIKCNKPSQILNAVENFEWFEKIDFQLEKLITKIEKIIINSQDYPFYQKTKEEDLFQLKEIVLIAKNLLVLNIIDNHSIENIADNIENLKSISKQFDGGPGIYLYIQRLRQLAKEKYREISSRLPDQESISSFKFYYTAKKYIAHPFRHTKNARSDYFGKTRKALIFDDIQSTCERKSTTRSELFQNICLKASNNKESKNFISDGNNSEFTRYETLNFLTNPSSDEINSHLDSCVDMSYPSQKKLEQRSFYMLCLELKKKKEDYHSCQKVSIPLLFQEACKFNIQKENWTEFIEAAFRNPIKYLRKKTNSIMLREKIKKIVN